MAIYIEKKKNQKKSGAIKEKRERRERAEIDGSDGPQYAQPGTEINGGRFGTTVPQSMPKN